MNRREVICGLGTLSIDAAIRRISRAPFGPAERRNLATTPTGAEALPSVVAGVRLVDSKIAKLATEFSRSVSPPYLFNHAVRTFLFGSLAGRALGQKFEEEILYLACYPGHRQSTPCLPAVESPWRACAPAPGYQSR